MIKYALYPNPLTTDDTEDQIARPVNVEVRGISDLVTNMTGPGSILKPTECHAVHSNYWKGIRAFLAAGKAYSDEYISIRYSIHGSFDNENDVFDPDRHTLNINVQLKSPVIDVVDDVKVRKSDPRTFQPEIETLYDWGSDTRDQKLTPGGVLEITGGRLKIQGALESEGVFFIKQADNSETKATRVRTNLPSELTVLVPKLTTGSYRIEVRNTQHSRTSLRTGLFPPLLTVI